MAHKRLVSLFVDCNQITITGDGIVVTAGESIDVTCSISCFASPIPTLTLYKNTADAVGTAASGQAISVTVQKDDSGARFYCDADDWSVDVRSRELTFDVQCKFH